MLRHGNGYVSTENLQTSLNVGNFSTCERAAPARPQRPWRNVRGWIRSQLRDENETNKTPGKKPSYENKRNGSFPFSIEILKGRGGSERSDDTSNDRFHDVDYSIGGYRFPRAFRKNV